MCVCVFVVCLCVCVCISLAGDVLVMFAMVAVDGTRQSCDARSTPRIRTTTHVAQKDVQHINYVFVPYEWLNKCYTFLVYATRAYAAALRKSAPNAQQITSESVKQRHWLTKEKATGTMAFIGCFADAGHATIFGHL